MELPQPAPNENQVRVRISASCGNPLDTKIRAGNAGHANQPLPSVFGLDLAGTAVQVGARVNRFKPGDEVHGMVGGAGGLETNARVEDRGSRYGEP